MRKRPCLLFACIFLTGLAFQRYQWKILVCLPVIFLGSEIYYGITNVLKNAACSKMNASELGKTKPSSNEQGNVTKNPVCGNMCRKFGRMAVRSVLLLTAFFLGMSHMKAEEDFRNAYMSKIEDGGIAVIWGEITKIEETDYGSRLILADCYVSLQEAKIPCNKVMVYASSDHFRVGQIYQINGQLNLFERARNDGNFDSALFYQSQKIDFSVYEEESILLADNPNIIRDGLLELKERMEWVYRSSLEEGAAGFYMGMMLGDKSLLQDRTKDLFAIGGISHILAISGLHMSIIGRGFYTQLRKHRIGFLSAGLLAGLLLFAYCYMVGNGVSAMRAVGMMLIYFIAQYLGRSYDMLNALGAMMIFLLWDNPFLLEYSGFQFSIAALAGVGFVGQTLSQQVKLETKRGERAKKNIKKLPWVSRLGNMYTKEYSEESMTKHAKGHKEECKIKHTDGNTEERMTNHGKECKEERMTNHGKECKEEHKSKHEKESTEKNVVKRIGTNIGKNVCQSIWMSIGITLSTLPIVAYCYYEVPLYSPLVNSIALPILTPVFAMALFGALIGCVVPIVGQLILIPCGWLFSFYEWICELVESLPFGSVITGIPELEKIVVYYTILLIGCFTIGSKKVEDKSSESALQGQQSNGRNHVSMQKENYERKSFLENYMIKLVFTFLCFAFILWPSAPQSEIVFLDVGQGDGIYIGSEDGTTFFIDGGSSDINQVGTYRILPFLKSHGVKEIDYWFVSHADTDHISGLLEVMEEGYKINYIVVSDKMPEDENQERILSVAKKHEIEVLYMKTGDQICSDNIQVRCLYPWEEAEDRNEQSMVLLLDVKDEEGNKVFRGLFTGDISSDAEQQLLEKDLLEEVDLYKAAHHGSRYSNAFVFLEAIQPEYCVVSCGIDNSYGHPHAETMERLAQVKCNVFSTAEAGQITLELKNRQVLVLEKLNCRGN